MRLSTTLSTGQHELPALEQRALHAAQQLTEQRNSLEILFQEAAAEPHAVNEQIQALGSLLKDNRQQQRDYEDLQRLSSTQQALDDRLQALQSKLQALQSEREQRIELGTQTKKQYEAAEQALNVTRQLLERQRLARSASVEELREHLQDNQPCPVCGSH